ncbi:uncharacterized protein BDFB_007505 [Asbolus verrucosus]|uniref:EF-hand domain-containing protein n=1 Tax=Asbolus verrucosus TaxID=1661398 RepID=A0A482WE74_ASBVE|nr:uncharacterized protein BDFB_007505 [Asbolus verrucosus]
MLVTGFGMRNLESLQRALLDDEQRRQMLLARHAKDEEFECSSIESSSTSKLLTKASIASTETSSTVDLTSQKLSLQYLMGIAEEGEEEYGEKGHPFAVEIPEIEGEIEDEALKRMTPAMRKARKYLTQHRIFEFFRFIIAHMLSELPENPIQFIIDLLDKCLVYRSGFGNPPLLYEKPHLEQLFYLMDRMRTGYIDLEQTLGICNYDKKPPLSTEGLVAQETFVEEAYDSLTDLFVEMIRRRGGKLTPPSLITPPPTEVKLASSYITEMSGQ